MTDEQLTKLLDYITNEATPGVSNFFETLVTETQKSHLLLAAISAVFAFGAGALMVIFAKKFQREPKRDEFLFSMLISAAISIVAILVGVNALLIYVAPSMHVLQRLLD